MARVSKITPLLKGLPTIRMTMPRHEPSIYNSRPYRYSQSPLKLFFEDAATFGNVLWTIFDIVRPLNAKDDGDVELNKTWRAKRDSFLISGISALQAFMLPAGIVSLLILPGLLSGFIMASMFVSTFMILKPVQGPRLVESKVDLDDGGNGSNEYEEEKWIFLNGVMTGHTGLQSAVDAIARVFKRPVLGIHNETSGFFGDVLECLMQRCFAYSTLDVRVAYQEIYNHITRPEVTKIVLIAHSQGGLIASLVVDRLFAELPSEVVGKLEIYTFGSAASHFNDPSHRQPASKNSNRIRGSSRSRSPAGVQEESASGLLSQSIQREFSLFSEIHASTGSSTASMSGACPDHEILAIEHYANEHDPIPRWGVLHAYDALFDTRYSGNLFVRMGASGHFFTSHYLAAWFPMDAQHADQVKNQKVVLGESTSQDAAAQSSNSSLSPRQWNDSMLDEATNMEWGNGASANKRDLEAMEEARKRLREGQFYALGKQPLYNQRMEKMSRLWQYVDGGSPQ